MPYIKRGYESSGNLCFGCKKATDGSQCCWVDSFTPVPGWEAEPTIIKMEERITESYDIKKCPNYEADRKEINMRYLCTKDHCVWRTMAGEIGVCVSPSMDCEYLHQLSEREMINNKNHLRSAKMKEKCYELILPNKKVKKFLTYDEAQRYIKRLGKQCHIALYVVFNGKKRIEIESRFEKDDGNGT